MARIHGRNAIVYFAIASGGEASAIPFQSKWSVDFSVEKAEVTAFGDTNKIYVAGLPDASGDFGGFYDDATAQTLTAAQDGVERKFYLYPNKGAATKYFFGTILADFSAEAAVNDAVKTSASWNAASPILKVG